MISVDDRAILIIILIDGAFLLGVGYLERLRPSLWQRLRRFLG